MNILSSLWILPGTVIGSFRYADWNAARRRGRLGVVVECWRSLIGSNTSAFIVPLKGKGGASTPRLKLLMKQHHVRAWGWGEFNGEVYWRVRRQQEWLVGHFLWQNGIHVREARRQ